MTMKNEPSISDTSSQRTSVTESIAGKGVAFAVTVGFHPTYGHPLEVFLTQRGRSDFPFAGALYDLGATASKIMQEYDTSSRKILDLENQLSLAKNQLLHYRQIVGETD